MIDRSSALGPQTQHRRPRFGALLVLLPLVLPVPAAVGQPCANALSWLDGSAGGEVAANCSASTPPIRCYPPEIGSPAIDPGGCDPRLGPCNATVRVPVTFPGNHLNDPSLVGFGYSYAALVLQSSSGGNLGTCGLTGAALVDESGVATFAATVSCAQPPPTFTLLATSCPCSPGIPCDLQPVCPKEVSVPIDLSGALSALCGPSLPPPPCEQCGSCSAVGGSAPPSSPGAPGKGRGNGGGADLLSGLLSVVPPGSGGGVTLRYLSGGVGHPGYPGSAEWNTRLGRHWSHEGMERIVVDPDASPPESHVWLLTREGAFVEFTDTDPLDPEGLYESVAPSDETMARLHSTATGWELRHLDGLLQRFDGAGRWQESVDRNGNSTVATWSGSRLDRIDLPDGRSETFGYDASGRLVTLTVIGVDGTSTRTWSYGWSGLDLVRIDRPDGTAWELRYDDPDHPGWLTRMTLVGTDDTSRRVEGAWEYDDQGRVTRSWRGATSAADPQAVDVWQHRYDDPGPGHTTVVDPLGSEAIYTLDRDPASGRTRVLTVSGDCPSCGTGPNTQYQYDDPAHPLRPTLVTDGLGRQTLMTYDANGSLLSKTEALGTPEERTTSWEYENPDFPVFPTRIERPSTTGNPTDLRTTVLEYDASGNLVAERVEGVEAGLLFSHETVTTYTAEGQTASADPPGHGTDDVTEWSYDPTRGGLVPASRTDPVIGVVASTVFGYDAFNRPSATTDPNGLVSRTEYDALDRVLSTVQEGGTPSEDLVTESRYTVFGDLFQTVLPEGNVVEYGYDSAGRVVSIERKPDDDPSSHGERAVFVLDELGDRIEERLEVWNGSGWETRSRTGYLYTTRCHLDRVVSGLGSAEESVTDYEYDCAGNLEHVWDPNRTSTDPPSQSYVYDALDRLTRMTQPGGIEPSYEYDVQDHLTAVVDAEGNRTDYVYSDRDLLTRETSPVSGTTTHRYDEHGQLVETTDARGIVTTRTLDALDRVVRIDYSQDAEPREYLYDQGPFGLGRLVEGRSAAGSHLYEYDRFGRLVRDGELTYDYDRNGNRTQVAYPGDVRALYGFDFADRERTLELEMPDLTLQTIVLDAAYEPSGPLARLELGNGLVEERDYDARYYPSRIRLAASGQPATLDWNYTVDPVGNPLAISDPVLGDRTYGYDPVQYFLTRGDGPWGQRSWTYDKIGNRLSETTETGLPQTYVYVPNGTSGNTAILDRIEQGGPFADYTYDAEGNLVEVDRAGNVVSMSYDGTGRFARGERASVEPVRFVYDHRDFLSFVEREDGAIFRDDFESGDTVCWSSEVPGPGPGPGGECAAAGVEPSLVATYDSSGVLHALERAPEVGGASELELVVAFAGRPMGLVRPGALSAAQVRYLTADHLGTPVAMTDSSGAELWQGGFEPFGEDWSGAGAAGMFLRFPGQWVDGSWGEATAGLALFQNVHRWYQTEAGRYSRADPVGLWGGINQTTYAFSSPTLITDSLGLAPWTCGGARLEVAAIVGAAQTWGTCKSDCNGRFRWVFDFDWRQWGFGISTEIGLPGSGIQFSFDDGWGTADPRNFRFYPRELCSRGYSLVAGAGFGHSQTSLGGFHGPVGSDSYLGLGAGIFGGCGAFIPKNPRREPCCDDSTPPQEPTIGPRPGVGPRLTPTIGPAN